MVKTVCASVLVPIAMQKSTLEQETVFQSVDPSTASVPSILDPAIVTSTPSFEALDPAATQYLGPAHAAVTSALVPVTISPGPGERLLIITTSPTDSVEPSAGSLPTAMHVGDQLRHAMAVLASIPFGLRATCWPIGYIPE